MSKTRTLLSFLRKLKKNNSKDWMQANKPEYLSQRALFVEIVQIIIDALGTFDQNVAGLEPKDCIFRINRDIRFSKDKSLYKTHFGAYMARDGRKSMLPGYYFHLEPGNKSILAAGMYRPGSEMLRKVRQEIDYNGQDLVSIVENNNWIRDFGDLQGERLARAPKGYTTDHPLIKYLQLKSYLAVRSLTDIEVNNKGFLNKSLTKYKEMYPLVKYLNTAIT